MTNRPSRTAGHRRLVADREDTTGTSYTMPALLTRSNPLQYPLTGTTHEATEMAERHGCCSDPQRRHDEAAPVRAEGSA